MQRVSQFSVTKSQVRPRQSHYLPQRKNNSDRPRIREPDKNGNCSSTMNRVHITLPVGSREYMRYRHWEHRAAFLALNRLKPSNLPQCKKLCNHEHPRERLETFWDERTKTPGHCRDSAPHGRRALCLISLLASRSRQISYCTQIFNKDAIRPLAPPEPPLPNINARRLSPQESRH